MLKSGRLILAQPESQAKTIFETVVADDSGVLIESPERLPKTLKSGLTRPIIGYRASISTEYLVKRAWQQNKEGIDWSSVPQDRQRR